MTDTRAQLRAAFLTVIMVLSVLAIGTAGIGAAGPADEGVHDLTETGVSDVQTQTALESPDDAVTNADSVVKSQEGKVGPRAANAEGETRALVFLEQADVGSEMSPDTVEQTLKAQADRVQSEVTPKLEELGVEVRNGFWITNALVVKFNADEVSPSSIASVDGVRLVTVSPDVEPPEPIETDGEAPAQGDHTYGLEQINAPQFWDEYDTKGEGATIVIQDNGFATDHEALQFEEAHMINSDGEKDGPPAVGEHGTHVAGTASGTEDPDGLAFGVAPNVNLHGHDIFSADDVVAASIGSMQIAAEEDATAVSGSWGSGCNSLFPQPVYNDAQITPIHNTRLAGTEVVSSAGNAGNCVGGFANDYESFSIGASNQSMGIAGFSSGSLIDKDTGQPDWPDAGAWNDPPADWPQSWVAPRVAAPGVNVHSSIPGGYSSFSGTSMAAPHVAGSLALLQSLTDDKIPGPELRKALIETAKKPDDWDESDARWTNDDVTAEQPGIDSRYGYGVIDVMAAAEEVGPAVPEFDVGDANEDGEVRVSDAQLILRVAVGQEPGENETFNENLADANRDGEVTVDDARLTLQRAVGLISADMTVSNLDAPDSASGGDVINVSADLENVGDMGTIQGVDFRLAETADDLGPNATLATNAHDLGPAGSDNATATTNYEIDTTGLPGGEYVHGVFTEDDNVTDTITITSPFFEVSNLEAPDEVVENNEITVNATITNTGNEADTQNVTFQFAGDTLLTREDVQLDPGNSTQVTFEPVVDADPGTYEHGISTNDDSQTATIDVIESVFSVSDVSGPTDVTHGDSYTVDATVTNAGNATDEQTIQYELGFGGGDVAVLDTGIEPGHDGAKFVDILRNEFSDLWSVELRTNLDDFIADIDQYDVIVVQRISGDSLGVDPGAANDFFNAVSDQGVVLMDSAFDSSAYADGVRAREAALGTPTGIDDSNSLGTDAHLHITEDHQIYTGVGSPGDVVSMYDEDRAAWFSSFADGNIIGDVGTSSSAEGAAVAVTDDGKEVLLSHMGQADSGFATKTYTEEAKTLLANSVEYSLTGQVSQLSGHTETVELEPGESVDVSFNYTATADDGIGDLAHIVSSNDDSDDQAVSVTAPDQIQITNYSAPAEVPQNEQITAEIELEHVGTEQDTTQDIEFTFGDGLINKTETVTMSAGETETVTLDVAIPGDLAPGVYSHGASVKWDDASAEIEVLEGEPANFAVSGLDAPAEAGQYDTFNVSATIENTGNFEGTQTIEYEFNIDAGGGGGDEPPELSDVSVAYVDSTRGSSSAASADARELYAQELRQTTDLSESEIQTRVEQVDPNDHDDEVDAYVDTLRSNLDSDVFTVDEINSANLLDNMDYDVYVIQQFDDEQDDDPPNPNPRVNDFLDQLGDDQGVVYLDQWSNWRADGVVSLGQNTDRLTWERSTAGADPQQMEILQDHQMFEGVGSAGDTVTMQNADNTLWFNDYDGTVIGDNPTEDGAAVGVHEGRNEVIMTPAAPSASVGSDLISDDSKAMAANAVVWSAEQALLDGSSATASEDGITTMNGQPIKIHATETVTLGGGESTTVDFEFEVPGNLADGTYGHGIFSEDDDATGEIYIFGQSPEIEVTGQFPQNDSLQVGDDLVTDATVVNSGDVAGERDIRLNVDGEVRDTVTVQLDPGEVTQVTLQTTMTEAGQYVVSVNGQDPKLVTVSDSGATAQSMPGVPVAVAG